MAMCGNVWFRNNIQQRETEQGTFDENQSCERRGHMPLTRTNHTRQPPANRAHNAASCGPTLGHSAPPGPLLRVRSTAVRAAPRCRQSCNLQALESTAKKAFDFNSTVDCRH
eukprot:1195445-Prorocentrum_minimum.AAC.3